MCQLFGKSRQAYYQSIKQNNKAQIDRELVIQLVQKIRQKKKRTGTRKLYIELKNSLEAHGIKIGRNRLFDILREHGMLVRERKSKVYTTQSHHWLRKYPNLIRDFEATKAGELWVSDITYIRVNDGFAYLYLITDAYSRKIVGWYLADSLHAKHAIWALEFAVKAESPKAGLIYHSDRGVQYCSANYVNVLQSHNAKISMTENGDPRENAIAERVNGILKDEWINDLIESNKIISEIIHTYNTDRLHTSIDYLTPEQAHQMTGKIKRKWKTYYKKIEKCSI